LTFRHDLSRKIASIEDVKALKKQAMAGTSLYPDVAENCMSTSFSHIFQGYILLDYMGEVLDADAFAYFKKRIFFIKKWPQNLKTTYFQRWQNYQWNCTNVLEVKNRRCVIETCWLL
jgi:Zn-dependent oligopeptidase